MCTPLEGWEKKDNAYLKGYPDLSWDQIDFDDLEDAQRAAMNYENCGGVTWTWGQGSIFSEKKESFCAEV